MADDLFDMDGEFTVQESDADRTLIRLSEYLLDEIADLCDLIQHISQDIVSVKDDQQTVHTTKKELHAIVEATSSATHSILNDAEQIEHLLSKASISTEVRESILHHITHIYESCTFQDITGQRVKKVMMALITIEERLDHVVNLLKSKSKLKHVIHADESTITKPKPHPDAQLMNGPSLPECANNQETIDDLFANLDKKEANQER